MKKKNVPYPVRVCTEILHFCFMSNKKTENMRASEIKNKLQVFFTEEQIIEAQKILTGNS